MAAGSSTVSDAFRIETAGFCFSTMTSSATNVDVAYDTECTLAKLTIPRSLQLEEFCISSALL
jgi:hypothetical protein